MSPTDLASEFQCICAWACLKWWRLLRRWGRLRRRGCRGGGGSTGAPQNPRRRAPVAPDTVRDMVPIWAKNCVILGPDNPTFLTASPDLNWLTDWLSDWLSERAREWVSECVWGEWGGGREEADTELKAKTPDVNVGKYSTSASASESGQNTAIYSVSCLPRFLEIAKTM